MDTDAPLKSQSSHEAFTVPSYPDDQAAIAAILRKCGVPEEQIDEFLAAYPGRVAPAA